MIIIKSKKLLGPVILISAAVIWGLSFVFQSEGSDIGSFTFNGIRMLVGSIVLLPFILINGRKEKKKQIVAPTPEEKKKKNLKDLKGILIVGLFLFAGSNLQNAAFGYIEVGKVGFITALYMILVPILGLFLKKRPSFIVWIAVGIGLVGLYFLCMGSGATLSFGKGEMLTLICAFCFAGHILSIDKFASEIDCVKLSCGQFFITGVLSVICMFIFEDPDIHAILGKTVPILYTGIMSCGVAFTFQIIGQKYTEPTLASMLLCLESVFSVIFAFLILNQKLDSGELLGCALMFTAIILAQIPVKKRVK